ncbi:radical SAM/SPASM domain-containing protein [Holophaga foetida]|uniref:radical SAM/SPASM domain-containing protein n=1 Tax=Holophaga foetida TaxID=35839 RepID=UPI000304490F|nr:radical SAM protein [Holophaga foetida]
MPLKPAIRYLVLWATADCNLDCVYCYRQTRGSETMSRNTAHAALALAASSGLPFHVQIAGGEPTLAPGVITTVVERIRNQQWPATIALQTNGTSMTEDLIRLCQSHSVDIGMSLDGPPAVHGQSRGRGLESYRTLGRLAEQDIPVRVTTVLSSLNVAHLEKLALALSTYPNVRGLALDPLVNLGRAAARPDLVPTPPSVVAGIRSLFTTVQGLKSRRRTPFSWRELDLVEKALMPQAMAGASCGSADYCHACRGESLAVAPDGRLYPCSQSVGNPGLQVGTLEAPDWKKLRSTFCGTRLNGPCETCPLAGRCPGDCPSRLAHEVGPSITCSIYRTLASALLRTSHDRDPYLLLQCHRDGTDHPQSSHSASQGGRL